MKKMLCFFAIFITVLVGVYGESYAADTYIENNQEGIEDYALYQSILTVADSNQDGKLSVEEAKNVHSLFVEDVVKSLKGIDKLTNLNDISLYGLDASRYSLNIEELSKLKELERVTITDYKLKDISPLAGLPKLVYLNLRRNELTDISSMENFAPDISAIYICENKISDISPLKKFTNLTELYLDWNNISDISVIGNFSGLRSLFICGNNISDISVLEKCTVLREVALTENKISDISPLIPSMKASKQAGDRYSLWAGNNKLSELPDLKSYVFDYWETPEGSGNYYLSLFLGGNSIDKEEAKAKLPANIVEGYVNVSGKRYDLYGADRFSWEAPIAIGPKVWFEMNEFLEPQHVLSPDNGGIVVDKAGFEEVIEKNKTHDIVIDSNENVSIRFAKETMKEVSGVEKYDFSSKFEKDLQSVPTEFSSKIDKDKFVCYIDYMYSGDLPATAEIKIQLGEEQAKKVIYYYLCKEDGALEYVSAEVADEDGYLTIKQSHCSSYIFLTEKVKAVEKDESEKATGSSEEGTSTEQDTSSASNNSTQTEEPTQHRGCSGCKTDISGYIIAALVVIVGIGAVGLFVFISKKKKKK